MAKFKVGDKVVCIDNESYLSSLTLDKEYTITGANDNFVFFTNDNNNPGSAYAYRFKLAQEKEMKSEAFNLKTTPWFIRVNNKEEFEAAKEWVISQGIEFDGLGLSPKNPIALVCSLNYPKDFYFYWLEEGEKPEPDQKEIKLTFKTVIDSVEYPVVRELRSPSERDLKIEELEQSIKEAQEHLNKLKVLK